jgi:hypothetical protein
MYLSRQFHAVPMAPIQFLQALHRQAAVAVVPSVLIRPALTMEQRAVQAAAVPITAMEQEEEPHLLVRATQAAQRRVHLRISLQVQAAVLARQVLNLQAVR